MANTSPIYIKVQTDVKEGVEAILKKTNTTLTEAIDIYLKQIILYGKIPFETVKPKFNIDNNKVQATNNKHEEAIDKFMKALLDK